MTGKQQQKKTGRKTEPKKSAGEQVVEFLKSIGFAIVAVVILNSFVLASFQVPTGSMENTVLAGDLLFGVEDGGVATCWEARTGTVVWNERLGGNYSASLLAAPGRLYACSEEGKIVVIATDTRDFTKLAENKLGDGFMASPAVSGRALFLRSRTRFYRVERQQ